MLQLKLTPDCISMPLEFLTFLVQGLAYALPANLFLLTKPAIAISVSSVIKMLLLQIGCFALRLALEHGALVFAL